MNRGRLPQVWKEWWEAGPHHHRSNPASRRPLGVQSPLSRASCTGADSLRHVDVVAAAATLRAALKSFLKKAWDFALVVDEATHKKENYFDMHVSFYCHGRGHRRQQQYRAYSHCVALWKFADLADNAQVMRTSMRMRTSTAVSTDRCTTRGQGRTGGSGPKVVKSLDANADDAEDKRPLYKRVDARQLDHLHVLRLYTPCGVGSFAFFLCGEATHDSLVDFLKPHHTDSEEETAAATQRTRVKQRSV
ncbi:serine/threonine protein kinase [Phytophthora cinnamomi]|uniref:serine/threonine protein kinase n=1 Tax=Phytophthora cinnamomi TaxID=4785 RepID=UPI00355AA5AD|nr:serine/threonine protein kinase [Phytophthora cinnamomi]